MTDEEARKLLAVIHDMVRAAMSDEGIHLTRSLILGAIGGMASCGIPLQPHLPGLLHDALGHEPAEYDCQHCGIHVVRFGADKPPDPALCLDCQQPPEVRDYLLRLRDDERKHDGSP